MARVLLGKTLESGVKAFSIGQSCALGLTAGQNSCCGTACVTDLFRMLARCFKMENYDALLLS